MALDKWHRLSVLVLCILISCTNDPVAPPDRGGDVAAPPGISSRELAAALRSPGAAKALFHALKASPYSEHKVVLQDLVRSTEGAPLLAAIAELRGTSVELVAASILAE